MNFDEASVQDQLEETALLGVQAKSLVHEFNNFLNTLLLQVAVMETTASPTLRPHLELFRKEGKNMAKIINDWQRQKRLKPDRSQSLDLNQIIRDLVSGSFTGPARSGLILLELMDGPLTVKGSALELRLLCRLLIQCTVNSLENQPTAGSKMVVRTEKDQNQGVLKVFQKGPHLTHRDLTEFFDPAWSAWLELSACKTLAQRFQGRLYVENQPQDGMSIIFVTPATEF